MAINHIYIGFAGKRLLEKDQSAIPLLQEVFTAMDRHFSNTHFHFISGLADGADQLATTLFQETRWQPEQRNVSSTGALIAFPKADYLETIENKSRFNSLYEQCKHTVQLDGIFREGEEGTKLRARAHRQQGRGIVMLADILIVVSELDEAIYSNSKETATVALHKGIPVIFLNLTDQRFYYFKDLEQWANQEKVPQSADEMILAFAATVPPAIAEQPDELPDLTREKKRPGYKWRSWINNGYERIFKVKRAASEHPDLSGISNVLCEKVYAIRKKMSELSSYYQSQYRGGYMLNYLIAVLAVLVAVTGVVVYIYKEKKIFGTEEIVEKIAYGVIIALGIVKTVLIIIMIRNTHDVNHSHYNKKAIDSRYIAERLRVNYYLAFFGFLKAPRPSLGNHIQDYLSNYPGEINYQQLLDDIREEQSDIAINKEKLSGILTFIINDWFKGQAKYHEAENRKMYAMHHLLEARAELLSKIVLVIVIAEILLLASCHFFELLPHELTKIPSPLLMALTILLPTVITTLNGIIFQTEARKIAFRSQLIHSRINALLQTLEAKRAHITNSSNTPGYEGSYAIEVLEVLYKMAAITTDEVAEWSLLYEKPVLDQG